MTDVENDPKLRELCERASKEFDHERLMDLVKQINDLLEKKEKREQDSTSVISGDLQVVGAVTNGFTDRKDRWIREWLEYQPQFIALAC